MSSPSIYEVGKVWFCRLLSSASQALFLASLALSYGNMVGDQGLELSKMLSERATFRKLYFGPAFCNLFC